MGMRFILVPIGLGGGGWCRAMKTSPTRGKGRRAQPRAVRSPRHLKGGVTPAWFLVRFRKGIPGRAHARCEGVPPERSPRGRTLLGWTSEVLSPDTTPTVVLTLASLMATPAAAQSESPAREPLARQVVIPRELAPERGQSVPGRSQDGATPVRAVPALVSHPAQEDKAVDEARRPAPSVVLEGGTDGTTPCLRSR